MPFLLRIGYGPGRLDLRDLQLGDAHIQRLALRLAHITGPGVTGVDARGNGAIGASSILALEGAIAQNDELLSVKCNIAQERLQIALRPHQDAFQRAANIYFCGLKARYSSNLEPEHVAQIGAMAHAEYFVPRGPRLYERAEALLMALLLPP